jgi:hypothetical protein
MNDSNSSASSVFPSRYFTITAQLRLIPNSLAQGSLSFTGRDPGTTTALEGIPSIALNIFSFTQFAAVGSVGLVSVASNVWPKETNLYVEQALSKSFDAKDLWETSANSLFFASNPIPAKSILAKLSRIKNDTMMPPLSATDLSEDNLSEINENNNKITTWYEDQRNM